MSSWQHYRRSRWHDTNYCVQEQALQVQMCEDTCVMHSSCSNLQQKRVWFKTTKSPTWISHPQTWRNTYIMHIWFWFNSHSDAHAETEREEKKERLIQSLADWDSFTQLDACILHIFRNLHLHVHVQLVYIFPNWPLCIPSSFPIVHTPSLRYLNLCLYTLCKWYTMWWGCRTLEHGRIFDWSSGGLQRAKEKGHLLSGGSTSEEMAQKESKGKTCFDIVTLVCSCVI